MNFSDTYKFIWWSTGGAATRSVAGIFQQGFDLKTDKEGKILIDSAGSHDVGIPNNCSDDYKIICNVRNPYSWYVASFTDLDMESLRETGKRLDFAEYVKKTNGYDFNVSIQDRWEGIRAPDYFIKMEDIRGSIENMPVLQPLPDIDWDLHKENYYKHKDDKSESHREYDENGVRCDWKKYYNQELADIVYNEPRMKEMFEISGYERDSWK